MRGSLVGRGDPFADPGVCRRSFDTFNPTLVAKDLRYFKHLGLK